MRRAEKLQFGVRLVQKFAFAGRFVQEFRPGGPGFESDPIIKMNGELKRQDMQNVVQKMYYYPVER